MGWGSIGGLVGGVFGGILGNSVDAQGRAADKQESAINRATDIQDRQFQQVRQDNMPLMDARNVSLDRMRTLLGLGGDTSAKDYGTLGGAINPADVVSSPGYQFGLNEGLKAQSNMLGARGMRYSGTALKVAPRYAIDYATTKYGDAFNRELTNRQQQLAPLNALAGFGQQGVAAINQAGQNNANAASENALQIGNVGATKSIGQANIWQGAANQGIGLLLGGR